MYEKIATVVLALVLQRTYKLHVKIVSLRSLTTYHTKHARNSCYISYLKRKESYAPLLLKRH